MILDAASKHLGTFVWAQLTKHAPSIINKIIDRRRFDDAISNYLARYENTYGFVKPLGLTNPIALEKIYTEVKFTTENLREYYAAKGMETAFKASENGFQNGWKHVSKGTERAFRGLQCSLDVDKIQQMDGISAANKFQRMLVLGDPGGGKSTYIQRIGWECLRTHGILENGHSGNPQYVHSLLPVLLEMKRCRKDEKASLLDLLAREFADCGFPESVDIVDTLLSAGKILVLLDALDEVAKERVEDVIAQAQTLVRRYPECRFIISCRVAFRHDYFVSFQDVTLLSFTDSQINQFINNWFSSSEQKAENVAQQFISALHCDEHAPTLELARSPVLLGYLCVGYQCTLELSTNRAEVYRRALDIFLHEWNAKNLKTNHTRMVHPSLPHETELSMLAQIAYNAFSEEKFFLTTDEWLEGIRTFMADLVDKPITLSASDILNNIAVSQGLVVQRTHNHWSFSHLTLQEYLTAYHIDRNGLLLNCVNSHLDNSRWEVVFLILAGIKPGALLSTMMKCTRERLQIYNPSWEAWCSRLNSWGKNLDDLEMQEKLVAIKIVGFILFSAKYQFRFETAAAITETFTEAIKLAQGLAQNMATQLALGAHRDAAFIFSNSLNRFIDLVVEKLRCFITFDRPPAGTGMMAEDLINFIQQNNLASAPMLKDLKNMSEVFKFVDHRNRSAVLTAWESLPEHLSHMTLPTLDNIPELNRYFKSLNLMLRCKQAAARIPLRKQWTHVLDNIF